VGSPDLEAPSAPGRHGARAQDRAEHSLSISRQLPAWSPLTLGAIGSGVAALFSDRSAGDTLATRIRAEYTCADAALVDSGTTALALAFAAAAPAQRRARIALPAYGCFDLMTAADSVDAEVALYDLDPATLAPDLDSLARATRAGVDAVVVAHWYGLPADLGPARELAGRMGALVIEDAAQGVGTSLAGRPAGSTGDFGVLSFGRGKGRTGGHGGALLANSPRAASLMSAVTRSLSPAPARIRDLAALLAQWMLGRPALYGIPAAIPMLRLGETAYRPPSRAARIPRSSAAVANAVWERSAREVAIRRSNAARWSRILGAAVDLDVYGVPSGSESGWLRFPVRARGPMHAALAEDRSKRLGVMPGYPKGLAELPVAPTRLRDAGARYPGADELTRSLFTLPTHALLRTNDVRAMAARLGLDGPAS
jgi:dTDP-4-amino-4,6-dideoxygalactose transaminase